MKPRAKPYWRMLAPEHHIGYRRHRGSPPRGVWIARRYLGAGCYEESVLGVADDGLDANGEDVLDFAQAQATAQAWFTRPTKEEKAREAAERPHTVAEVLESYLAWHRTHRKAHDRVRYSVEAHILPVLGALEVSKLEAADLRHWHEELAATGRRVRSRKGSAPRVVDLDGDEARRRRKVSANRSLTIIKAALNRALEHGVSAPHDPQMPKRVMCSRCDRTTPHAHPLTVADDQAWRRVKPFRHVESPRVEYLAQEEARRLVNASPPDFRRLVQAALLTGARYGELVRMRVRDYSRDSGSVRIATSKSGKPRDVYLNAEGVAFFEEVAAGKRDDALLFTRSNGEPWGASHQARPMTEACAAADIRRLGFHALRHTYGSTLAMQGVDMAVIARQLGHADTRITQRHYAHLAPSYVADVVRRNLPAFGIVEMAPKVRRIRRKR